MACYRDSSRVQQRLKNEESVLCMLSDPAIARCGVAIFNRCISDPCVTALFSLHFFCNKRTLGRSSSIPDLRIEQMRKQEQYVAEMLLKFFISKGEESLILSHHCPVFCSILFLHYGTTGIFSQNHLKFSTNILWKGLYPIAENRPVYSNSSAWRPFDLTERGA